VINWLDVGGSCELCSVTAPSTDHTELKLSCEVDWKEISQYSVHCVDSYI